MSRHVRCSQLTDPFDWGEGLQFTDEVHNLLILLSGRFTIYWSYFSGRFTLSCLSWMKKVHNLLILLTGRFTIYWSYWLGGSQFTDPTDWEIQNLLILQIRRLTIYWSYWLGSQFTGPTDQEVHNLLILLIGRFTNYLLILLIGKFTIYWSYNHVLIRSSQFTDPTDQKFTIYWADQKFPITDLLIRDSQFIDSTVQKFTIYWFYWSGVHNLLILVNGRLTIYWSKKVIGMFTIYWSYRLLMYKTGFIHKWHRNLIRMLCLSINNGAQLIHISFIFC